MALTAVPPRPGQVTAALLGLTDGVRSDNTGRPSNSNSAYDANGHLTSITEDVWNDSSRSGSPDGSMVRAFVNDASGIALQKVQQGHVLKQLVVAGNVLTSYGNGTDPNKQLGNTGRPNYIDQGAFGNTYQAINSSNAAGSSGYTVKAGDSLQGVAQMMWGDAALWYRIADANGLSGNAALSAGQRLAIPNQTGGVHNNASTFKPYDPSKVTGDTTPNLPLPPPADNGGGGCGGLGLVIMIIVAVVVTVLTEGATSEFLISALGETGGAIAAGAVGAAAGSIASQAVGNALGIVDGFSWKAVALAALSAGVTQGLPAGDMLFTTAGTIENTIVRAAVANALTQGIAVATGLQDHFDWRGVAASAIGAGVGGSVGKGLGTSGSMGEQIFKAGLTGLAAGTATALARGGRVSVQQIATDTFGNAIGASLGQQAVTRLQEDRQLQVQATIDANQSNFRVGEISQQNQGSSTGAL